MLSTTFQPRRLLALCKMIVKLVIKD